MTFINTKALGDRFRNIHLSADPPLQGVILTLEGVNFIDVEGADTLNDIAKVGKTQDIDFRLVRVKPQVLEVLQKEGVFDLISPERIHDNIAEAVEAYRKVKGLEF